MTISQGFRQAMYAQETKRAILVMLKIDHADLGTPIRVVNNSTDYHDGTNNWVAFPFEIVLPSMDEATIPKAQVRICNVDRSITQAIRSLSSAPTISIMAVLDDYYTTHEVEYGPVDFKLRSVTYNTFTVEGELQLSEIFDEPYPGDTFSPRIAPGLF